MADLDIEREIANRGVPTSAQATYRRALKGSRPSAVKAMCLECQGWEDGARKAIRDCPSIGCPLHAVRPYQPNSDITPGEVALETSINAGLLLGGAAPSTLEDHTAAVLGALSDTEWRPKKEILAGSGIDPSIWPETINYLLSTGVVERQGERKSTRYRRVMK